MRLTSFTDFAAARPDAAGGRARPLVSRPTRSRLSSAFPATIWPRWCATSPIAVSSSTQRGVGGGFALARPAQSITDRRSGARAGRAAAGRMFSRGWRQLRAAAALPAEGKTRRRARSLHARARLPRRWRNAPIPRRPAGARRTHDRRNEASGATHETDRVRKWRRADRRRHRRRRPRPGAAPCCRRRCARAGSRALPSAGSTPIRPASPDLLLRTPADFASWSTKPARSFNARRSTSAIRRCRNRCARPADKPRRMPRD